MTNRTGLAAILRKIEHPADRSTLFHWMVEHHDELTASADGARLVWADLCASFADMGLTCRTGQPATPAVARMTWYRARKFVAHKRLLAQRQALTGLAPRSLMPSASPRPRTPIEKTSPAVTAERTVGPDGRVRLTDAEVRAKMDRLRKTMAERRVLNGPRHLCRLGVLHQRPTGAVSVQTQYALWAAAPMLPHTEG